MSASYPPIRVPSGPGFRPPTMAVLIGATLVVLSLVVFIILNFAGSTYFASGKEPQSSRSPSAAYPQSLSDHDLQRTPAELLEGQRAIEAQLKELVSAQQEMNERIKVIITLCAGVLSLLFLAVTSAVGYAFVVWGKVSRFELNVENISHSADVTTNAANELRRAVNVLYNKLGEPLP